MMQRASKKIVPGKSRNLFDADMWLTLLIRNGTSACRFFGKLPHSIRIRSRLIIGINLFRERIHLRSRSRSRRARSLARSDSLPPPNRRGRWRYARRRMCKKRTGEATNGFPGSYVRDKRRSRNKMASRFVGESLYLALIAPRTPQPRSLSFSIRMIRQRSSLILHL